MEQKLTIVDLDGTPVVALPDPVLRILEAKVGTNLGWEISDRGVTLINSDIEFEKQWAAVVKVMEKDRDILRTLAKS